jgi:uncharacterized integral membrane protein (TIGR00698 family)
MENPNLNSEHKNKISFGKKITLQQCAFIVPLLLCLTPFVTPPFALLLGLLVTNTLGNPYLHLNQKATSFLLRLSVIGLGFGINVQTALQAGKDGFLFTIISLLSTLLLGALIGKWLAVEKKTSHLISCGTAICGGSAIAAIAPIIKADEKQTSIAVATIFILNSIALFLFPAIGHMFDLSQKQFGLWSAIAIHDTSSVVGAANKYGSEALQIATVVKLARTLWIIPIALITTLLFKNSSEKIKIPYFIGLFVIAMVIASFIPQNSSLLIFIASLSKTGLTLALFLIGTGLTRVTLKTIGTKPLVQGVLLWIFISTMALWAVIEFVT